LVYRHEQGEAVTAGVRQVVRENECALLMSFPLLDARLVTQCIQRSGVQGVLSTAKLF